MAKGKAQKRPVKIGIEIKRITHIKRRKKMGPKRRKMKRAHF